MTLKRCTHVLIFVIVIPVQMLRSTLTKIMDGVGSSFVVLYVVVPIFGVCAKAFEISIALTKRRMKRWMLRKKCVGYVKIGLINLNEECERSVSMLLD